VAHPASSSVGAGGPFAENKAAGSEADRTPLPRAEINKAWR
jgi:hypothetical protein